MEDRKQEYENIKRAVDTLIPLIRENDGCACMGPAEGELLCPCQNRYVAKRYLERIRNIVEHELNRKPK